MDEYVHSWRWEELKVGSRGKVGRRRSLWCTERALKKGMDTPIAEPWIVERQMRVERLEPKTFSLTVRPRMKSGGEWVEYSKRTSRELRATWRQVNLPTMAENNAEKVWKTTALVTNDGDVPGRTTTWWSNKSAWCTRVGPMNASSPVLDVFD